MTPPLPLPLPLTVTLEYKGKLGQTYSKQGLQFLRFHLERNVTNVFGYLPTAATL